MDDTTWSLIATERRTLADLLSGLTPRQWQTTSLCSEWTVRDVAAHLVMTPNGVPPVTSLLRALTRSRGRLWSAGRDVVVAYDAQPDELVTDLRRLATARTRPVFVMAPNILPDLVIHGQDIAVPLGLDRPVPPATGREVLDRIWGMGWPFWARRRFAGLTVRAEDCGWSAGQGPEVCGSAAHLLLTMTGRPGAGDLRGPGLAVLRQRTAAGAATSL